MLVAYILRQELPVLFLFESAPWAWPLLNAALNMVRFRHILRLNEPFHVIALFSPVGLMPCC